MTMANAAAHRFLQISCRVISHFKSKAGWKGKNLNDLDEVRLESTTIPYSYPLMWFDEVCIVSGSSDIAMNCVSRCVL